MLTQGHVDRVKSFIMEYCPPKKNSIEDCSHSDESLKYTEEVEVKSKTLKTKKARFRGFYQSQKTLVTQSTEDSIERGEEEEEDEAFTMDQSIPEIVEDLIPKSDTENSFSEEKVTEYSNEGESNELDCLDVSNDTTDEDVSELGPDDVDQKLGQKKRKLRISLKNLSESDDEKDNSVRGDKEESTDESDVEVTQMDYYKIRHQNDKVPFIQALPTDHCDELDEDEEETDESDVEVTEKDYYAIRHHAEKMEKTETEFSLSWSPTNFKPVCEGNENVGSFKIEKNCAMLKLPQYPSVDINDDSWMGDSEEVDDEDIPCQEEDFMSVDQFVKAHETNFELVEAGGKVSMMINPEVEEDENEDEDNTESINESLSGGLRIVEEEGEQTEDDDTDVSEIDTFVAVSNPVTKRDIGDIILMEHNDLEGTIAVYSPTFDMEKNITETNFKPELMELKDDLDAEDAVSELLEIMPAFKNADDTDHSDVEEMSEKDMLSPAMIAEPKLPPPSRKLTLIHTARNGGTMSVDFDLPEPQKVQQDIEVPTDDEQIEDVVMSPSEEMKVVEFVAPEAGLSTVITKEKTKKQTKRRRIKMAVEIELDDPVEEEL